MQKSIIHMDRAKGKDQTVTTTIKKDKVTGEIKIIHRTYE